MSQRADILAHLQKWGWITPIEALNEYGCFRLAARIKELRKLGHPIRTVDDLHLGGTHAKYVLDQLALL